MSMSMDTPFGWHVVGTTEKTKYTTDNQPVEGVSITYQLDSGQQGTVFVPRSQLGNTEAVSATVNAAAEMLHAVNNLSSGS